MAIIKLACPHCGKELCPDRGHNPSPYVGKHCHVTSGGMEHVAYIEEYSEHQVKLIGEGFAEPYTIGRFGNAVIAEMVKDGSLRIVLA